jgi:AbiV family abortive infection protein
MGPEKDQRLELVHALLENARGLTSDGRLLLDNGRYARSYALAALAGEELGKVEFCLDWLLGTPTLSPKEFGRSWQSHREKIAGLVAYQAAFIEDTAAVSLDDLRQQTATVGRRKMEAIYVDFNETGVVTPKGISAEEAIDLLESVETAVEHAAMVLGLLTQEVVAAANSVAAPILEPLAEHLTDLAPTDAINMLRELLARLPNISDMDWAAAIEADAVLQLLGLKQPEA